MPQENSYPTDLTDAQWKVIAPLVPVPGKMGRPRKQERRRILDAILYITQAGCAWRTLPPDFPPWETVYDYFRQWRRQGCWRHLHDRLRDAARRAAKKTAPTAAILDSQSVKTAEQGGVSEEAPIIVKLLSISR